MNQRKKHPDSAAALFLVATPLIAIIEHDAIPFINRTFGLSLQLESPELTRARHLAKSIDSKHLDYPEYSRQVQAILRQLNERFKNHTGVLGSILNKVQPDVGICYYRGMPIYGTYTVAHYLTKDNPSILGIDGGAYAKEMGYSAGTTGAVLYYFAAKVFPDKSRLEAPEFQTDSNNFSFSSLMKPLTKIGVEDIAVYFLLSELMMQVASVKALHEGGFFSDVLWLKFATISLYHAHRAIEAFTGYSHLPENAQTYPGEFSQGLSSVLDRSDRKLLKKAKPLRNALIHYDFKPSMVPDDVGHLDSMEILAHAVKSSLGMEIDEYCNFLSVTTDRLTANISSLIHFPTYSKWRRP